MTKVFIAQHPTEAHLVRGLLESGGIQAMVRGETLFGVRGEAPVTPDTLPSVWVLDDRQAAAALALIREHRVDSERAGNEAPWPCPNCGERVEPQFTSCWKCGNERNPLPASTP